MIHYQKKNTLLFYILLTIVIFSGLLYVSSKSCNITTEVIPSYFIKPFQPSKELCYRADGTIFPFDQLKKLYVSDNKSAYVNESDAVKLPYISKNYSNLTEFIENTREAFMSRRLNPGSHSIFSIFRNPPYKDMVKPSCDGLWMEFGVFRGSTLSHIAKWKTTFCGNDSEPVYGFDTFSGLPTDWRPGYGRGYFNVTEGEKIAVPSNVVLVKGLFIDTLPTHLRLIDRRFRCKTPVSFIHIDCDIYDGARDVLFLLGSRLVSGTILVFDELFNYPSYEKHEIKALFELLSGSNLRLLPIGASDNIDLKPLQDRSPQSFAFVTDIEAVQ
ncbi:unnamed protein product [Rotaria magnacalcarata]|uniref:Methyltransferase n=1 Tax=Rotaria magnacalcarata TaxID=392030 RepID=A0A816UXV6_9BILA|nr:unnamed protein product [Rotaria magnacalcarata]CAF1553202.1 unnamed protein product [Rotaria magnacalcarata]CAF2074388.1 unnamed protein product [Rotaria magnacalcarata]CAF2107118.1 unnamed protein product [Rotaria magnacalcarata]CAF4040412.1 unnamed protein product [Rotaria magnacalcarata]